jgi:hypothetical protein
MHGKNQRKIKKIQDKIKNNTYNWGALIICEDVDNRGTPHIISNLAPWP